LEGKSLDFPDGVEGGQMYELGNHLLILDGQVARRDAHLGADRHVLIIEAQEERRQQLSSHDTWWGKEKLMYRQKA